MGGRNGRLENSEIKFCVSWIFLLDPNPKGWVHRTDHMVVSVLPSASSMRLLCTRSYKLVLC